MRMVLHRIAAVAVALYLAACVHGPASKPPPAAAAGECPDNMVLACDTASRIAGATRVCQCQPARQVLNTTIEH